MIKFFKRIFLFYVFSKFRNLINIQYARVPDGEFELSLEELLLEELPLWILEDIDRVMRLEADPSLTGTGIFNIWGE